ncbi:hypothetical protein F5878DRAFT_647973, partial [Lentinula raphanica]
VLTTVSRPRRAINALSELNIEELAVYLKLISDTLLTPTPVTNSNIPTQDLWNTEQGVASEALAEASDSWVIRDTLRLTLEERYNEDSLRTTPLSELPPGFSLEQYVEQSLNRRRVAEFLAYAYALDKSRRSSGSNA